LDLSFSLQALCARYITENGRTLTGGVYDVPQGIDEQVARLKLSSLGLAIDEMREEQKTYLCSWDIGT
jgi:adenosylhomocysteinase